MTHTGQEIRLRLTGYVMLALVQLPLYHPAQLSQILVLLGVFQDFRLQPQNTNVAHIGSAVIHWQHHPGLPRLHAQENLNPCLSAV